jgi:hypothetical protein
MPFLRTPSPAPLFSVTVLDPSGQRASLSEQRQPLYEPSGPVDITKLGTVLIGQAPTFLPLSPSEDITWNWDVGQDFNMSAPGNYLVSFGGRIPYLDTTVCSNVAHVVVK